MVFMQLQICWSEGTGVGPGFWSSGAELVSKRWLGLALTSAKSMAANRVSLRGQLSHCVQVSKQKGIRVGHSMGKTDDALELQQ